MKPYKTVLMPIQVTNNNYCWGSEKGQSLCCPHFDNEGGHPTCDLDFDLPTNCYNGVLKPNRCKNLKEIK